MNTSKHNNSINAFWLCKYLISENKELIKSTAIKDCHAIGLNSFIINENPRMRLYTADPNCELYKLGIYIENPIIPIHRHKYRDLFFQLYGNVVHHIYDVENWIGLGQKTFRIAKYRYNRIGDSNKEIKFVDNVDIAYRSTLINPEYLNPSDYHTVYLEPAQLYPNPKCCWLIIETEEDSFFDFNKFAYSQDLKERPELYQKFDANFDIIKYLQNYLD